MVKSCPDCCGLPSLDENTILASLRQRYEMGVIYTYVASVLLAINPYRQIEGMYDTPENYRNLASLASQPPHAYAIADLTYRRVLQKMEPQVVIISGESGAGKTETAKIVMRFLGQRARTTDASADSLQQKILLGANPILESFGNATTVRNENSSRFGKYNALQFNPVGSLLGARIDTYLLESSRVVFFSRRERTYHVFYEFIQDVLHGDAEESRERYSLVPGKKYKLLHKNGADVDPTRDAKNYQALVRGLNFLSFSSDVKDYLWRTLAALIHLGEVSFSEGSDATAQIVDLSPLIQACAMLGIDAPNLEEALLVHVVVVAKAQNGVRRNSFYRTGRNVKQARATLESFIKMLYKRLFDDIVERINDALNASTQETPRSIGILDIYGFEKLELNSFEQLCINLANERLQQFFVNNVILEDQRMYEKEGIIVAACDVEEQVQVGYIERIFALLDDHNIRLAKKQKTSDEQFTTDIHHKFQTELPTATFVRAPRRGKGGDGFALNEGFVVKHYAGDVPYITKQWLEKNNARLIPEMERLLRASVDPFVTRLAADDEQGFYSVAKKYLIDLAALLETLRRSNQHYIRCFKPNHKRKPHLFDDEAMREQLIQCGTIALIRVMREGYPYRIPFQDLKSRFVSKLPFLHNEDPRLFLESLFSLVGSCEYIIGATRVFLRSQAVLEALTDLEPSQDRIDQIRYHIRRKKLRRCFLVIGFCLWVPRGVSQMRRGKIVRQLVSCTYIYLRLHRWKMRATHRLRQMRLFMSLPKLRATVRCVCMFKRAHCRARRRLRRDETLRNLEDLRKLVLAIVVLKRYIRDTLPEIRAFLKRSRRRKPSLVPTEVQEPSTRAPSCAPTVTEVQEISTRTPSFASCVDSIADSEDLLRVLEEQNKRMAELEEQNKRIMEQNRRLREWEEESRKLLEVEEQNRQPMELVDNNSRTPESMGSSLRTSLGSAVARHSIDTSDLGVMSNLLNHPPSPMPKTPEMDSGLTFSRKELLKESLSNPMLAPGGKPFKKTAWTSGQEEPSQVTSGHQRRKMELACQATRMERHSLQATLSVELQLHANLYVRKKTALDHRNGELADLYEEFGIPDPDEPEARTFQRA
eukprot:GEMP01002363.1.p1 GENE.GEMP01002363.1~~GEMP01002363.1.p1  ORF type:complete len:1101 (+),score=258.00 GEMP01002363.1:149-3451(+)